MRLINAPLVTVIAQVVIAPVLTIADHIAALQDRLIDLGFPRLQKTEIAELTFGSSSAPQQTSKPRWDFVDRDQRTSFILTDSSFVLHTTHYRSREPFFELFSEGLRALQGTAKVRIVERIGLRYIDLVQPEPGEDFQDYVHPGLLGFPFSEEGQLAASSSAFATQSIAATPNGLLAIRSAVLPQGQFVPPDLGPVSLLPPPTFRTQSSLAVDFDHFTPFVGPGTAALDFVPDRIMQHLETLHRPLRLAFDAIATKHAIDRWGPWERA